MLYYMHKRTSRNEGADATIYSGIGVGDRVDLMDRMDLMDVWGDITKHYRANVGLAMLWT
jgi:hypothetical protein